jgi:hypothetical protein
MSNNFLYDPQIRLKFHTKLADYGWKISQIKVDLYNVICTSHVSSQSKPNTQIKIFIFAYN